LKIEIFKSSKGIITNLDFEKFIRKFDLEGKEVLVYSRLLDFGRLINKKSIESILSILKLAVGQKGTLIIPTYTLNTYKEPRVFNKKKSKIMSGVLGEYSVLDSDFYRTLHPIYSNSIFGYNKDYYKGQKQSTCFGKGSFFDLFSKTEKGIILMLGINFNGPTLYHYYDQEFNAKGRFLKTFKVKIETSKKNYFINLDSFVKSKEFYQETTNCLAMLDAAASKVGKLVTYYLGDGMTHLIKEKNFKILYETALKVDQEYFLVSKKDVWKEYYLNNNFKLYYDSISKKKLDELKSKLET